MKRPEIFNETILFELNKSNENLNLLKTTSLTILNRVGNIEKNELSLTNELDSINSNNFVLERNIVAVKEELNTIKSDVSMLNNQILSLKNDISSILSILKGEEFKKKVKYDCEEERYNLDEEKNICGVEYDEDDEKDEGHRYLSLEEKDQVLLKSRSDI